MKSWTIPLIMLLSFSFSVIREVRAGDLEVLPDTVNSEELRGIRDRLSTSLFFKGELADSIIEAGLQERLVGLTGRETRSEVRLALIGWIKNNLEQAANIYFYLKNRRSGAPQPPEVISYKIPSWEINPHFLKLIEGVNRAAKDATISDEEMSLTAQRLFEGPQARPEAYAPWMPGGAVGSQGAGSAGAISYADYRLNPERVERESRALGGWFESVKAALEGEIADTENGKRLTPQRRLLDETFSVYGNFVVMLSGLKGRTKITKEEAARLEVLRRSLRKNLSELEASSVMRKINKRAQALRARSPGAGVLSSDARRIEAALKAFLCDLKENPESVKSAAPRFYELEKAFDFWTLRFSAHGRLADLKDRIMNRGFSCVLDKFVFEYLFRFCPSADYVRLEEGRSRRVKAIDVSLEGVAAGDYETAAFFSSGEKKSLAGQISETEEEAARLEAYSRFNGRVQFFFWDVFVNPFGLTPGPEGINAKNKLLF